MKRILLWVIVIEVVLLVGFLLHRSRSRSNLNVEPHALEEIEKAKRR